MSVVVPAHDCAETVPAQLAALARQRYEGPWEVVLVDNASTDGTRAVLERWAATRPNARAVSAVERQGAGYARNVGCRAATGDLLLFCDADDVVADDWIAEMAGAVRPDAMLAGADVPSLDDLGTPIPSRRVAEPDASSPRFLPFARGGNVGVPARLLAATGGWSEQHARGEDVELSWRLQTRGKELVQVPGARVWYRRPSRLPDLLRHQYDFGRQAPGLYRTFAAHGAPRWTPRLVAEDLLRLLVRCPVLLLASRRRGWLLWAAGVMGRAVGTLGEAVPVRSAARPREGLR